MNAHLIILEIAVIAAGLALLLIDLWLPAERRPQLGYVAAGAVALILIGSFAIHSGPPQYAFNNSYVLDPLALYFKRFFLLTTFFVLLMATDFADRISTGIGEFYALI